MIHPRRGKSSWAGPIPPRPAAWLPSDHGPACHKPCIFCPGAMKCTAWGLPATAQSQRVTAAQRTTWHPPPQSVVWLFCKAAGPQPVCILTSWGAAGPVAVPIRFPIWAHVWSCTFSCRLAATEKTTGPKGLWSGRWPKGAKGPARLSAPWTFCASWGCYLEPTQLSWWLECDSHPGHDQ